MDEFNELNGFVIGDRIVEHEHNYGKIIDFRFCKNNQQIMPVISANNRVYFAHWDFLRKLENLEQLNLFKPLIEGDTNEPPEGDFMETQSFKAITIRPPMSEMILKGIKDVENRPIAFSSRTDGQLLIHAGKTYDNDQAKWIRDNIGIEPPSEDECRKGGVIAIAEVETTLETTSKWAIADSKYYWNILEIKPIEFYPCRGQQGLFNCEIPINLIKEETEISEETEIKIGDWITTDFDYDLNLACLNNGKKNNIKRLGTVLKRENDIFSINTFPDNQIQIVLVQEAKLLPVEIIEQVFSLIEVAPPLIKQIEVETELNNLEGKSYLPDEFPPYSLPPNSTLEKIRISDIKIDDRTQPRDLSNEKTHQQSQERIADYASQKRQGVIFDPIEVIKTEEGYILATGYHRLQADIFNGETETYVIVRSGIIADAIAIGAIANAKQQHFDLSKKEKVNQAYRLF